MNNFLIKLNHFIWPIILSVVFIFIFQVNIKYLLLLPLLLISIFMFLKSEKLLYLYVFSLPFIGLGILNTLLNVNLGTGFQLSYLFTGLLVCVLIIDVLLSKNKILIVKSKVNIFIILLFFIAVLSLLMSFFIPVTEFLDEKPFVKTFKQLMQLFIMVCMYFVIVIFLNSKDRFKNCINILFISGFLVSCYGLYQFVGYYFKLPYTNIFSSNVGILTAHDSKLFLGSSFVDILRIRSTTPEPAMFSNYLICIIPLQIIFLIKRIYKNPKIRILHLFFLVVNTLAFILTFSKGGYLAILGSLSIIIWYLRNQIILKRLFFKTVVGIVFMLFVFGIFNSTLLGIPINSSFAFVWARINQITNVEDISNITRLNSYKAAGKMALYFPVLGVGLGNYGFYYNDFRPSNARIEKEVWPISNNIYLRVLSELGIIGFCIFCLIVYYLYKESKYIIKLTRNYPYWNSASIGLLASGVGILIQYLAIETLSFSHVWFIMAAIVSLKGIIMKSYKTKSRGAVENSN